MKTALLVVGLIVLVACALGCYFTYQSLTSTKKMLQDTQATLQDTQATLQDTQTQLQDAVDNLEGTQAELEYTATSLEQTRQELDEQKVQTDNYIQLYQDGLEEIEKTRSELDDANQKYASLQKTNSELQSSVDDLQRQLDVYKDTLGTQVFSGVLPPYNVGYLADLALIDNSNATDCTWEELVDFLREDDTDKNIYIDNVYMCGSYAQDLHNNAEAAGIRAAFVAIHFYEGSPHALNAFKTLDKGLVYIDVTGPSDGIRVSHFDKKARVEKDKTYLLTLIFPSSSIYYPPGESKVKSIEIYW
jgi:multidrug efflux pump subunit AcrA (membrane-fusion protein)